MIRRIATILARAGSKAIVDKNICDFLGEPLLVRSIRQAQRCGIFDFVVFSSDSDAYCDIAKNAGADFLVSRPVALADDCVTKLPGVRHAVEVAEAECGYTFDCVADLAVTSPLRTDEDVRSAVALLEVSGAPLVLSGCVAKDNPYFNMLEPAAEERYALSKQLPGRVAARQAAPPVFALNGAVYAWRRNELAKSDDSVVRPNLELYLMPTYRSIDIDEPLDLEMARILAQRSLGG